MTIISHRIWHLPADVDTDALAPGAYMQHGIEVIAQHCLENLLPRFAREVQRGDVLVAGPNFGIGSSREQAAAVLVQLGVAAVIAPSYSGLYFRNAFNVGLLLLTCPGAGELSEAQRIGLDLQNLAVLTNTGQRLTCEPIPDFLLDMVRSGGLLNQLRQRLARENATAPSTSTASTNRSL